MTALRDLLGDVAGMSIGYLTHQHSHQLLELSDLGSLRYLVGSRVIQDVHTWFNITS